ncbi:MAG TPA: ATP-binding protein [Prosthecobacter sp.]|nr:ATP-binding protein [Prosthecobacter sp.]
MSSPIRWHQSLAVRFGVAFVLFVVAGSSLLLAWLRHQQEQESQSVFATLARTDADFVQRLNLPRSGKLAHDLQQLLGMRIHFRDSAGAVDPPLPGNLAPLLSHSPPHRAVYTLPGQQQAIILRLDDRHDMIFIRDAATPALSLLHPATRNALLAFWLLSAALGWVIAGQVLRPLGTLTRRLPGFFTRGGPAPPEAQRPDEIGHLAQALTQARDELLEERLKREQSERLALLGRVATGLAHDIKNPLASIQLHAELMDAPPQDAQALQQIRDEAKVIEGLVNQWLYLARPASPQRVPANLRDCLQQTLHSLRGQAEHAGVTFISEVQDLRVLGDRSRLQQAFRNIMVNAIQAMPAGGTLSVTATQKDNRACLQFRDTGSGFSATALKGGTNLFYTEKEGGMGVGLNVVDEIISAHGGQMVLKNCPDGGAMVELCLPIDPSGTQSPPLS